MNIQKGFLLFVVGILMVMAGMMLRPFLAYLLGAVVLAFVLTPAQKRLSRYFGKSLSAGFLILLTFVIVLVPFGLIVGTVAEDAGDVINDLSQTDVVDIDQIEATILELTGQDVDLESEIQSAINRFVSATLGGFSAFLSFLTSVSIGISIMLFLLFYLLKDGEKFTMYLREVMPLPEEIVDRLYSRTYSTTWAVMKGHVLVAITQGLIAGIGLWFFGIPNFAFWTFVMVLLAFIPIVGAFLVWGPAGIYLILIGNTTSGILLLLYGSIVVGLTDNFLRPRLVDSDADLHPAVILIGVIGGVYIFGASGLFLGPVVFGILKSVLEVFEKNYDEL